VGKENKGAILTLTERKTGFLLDEKVIERKKCQSICQGTISLTLALQEFCAFHYFG
jgi:hypothetical protein